MKSFFTLLVFLALTGCQRADRKLIFDAASPEPIGPYSQAISAGGFLFVSGQIALRADGTLDTTSIENECRAVMENIRHIVTAGGSSMDRICKATIYTTSLRHFSTINSVYGTYFKKNPPARETVEVARLPKGARIEISVIASVE